MKLLVMVGELGAIYFRTLVEKILCAPVNQRVHARPSQNFLFLIDFGIDAGENVAQVNTIVDAIQYVGFKQLELRKPRQIILIHIIYA